MYKYNITISLKIKVGRIHSRSYCYSYRQYCTLVNLIYVLIMLMISILKFSLQFCFIHSGFYCDVKLQKCKLNFTTSTKAWMSERVSAKIVFLIKPGSQKQSLPLHLHFKVEKFQSEKTAFQKQTFPSRIEKVSFQRPFIC